MWPWFFSGLNNETPPSSSAGLTPPPGWRGALGDLPGFRREGRGGEEDDLGGGARVPIHWRPGRPSCRSGPPLGAVPISLPLGSLALCGASAPHEASFPSRPGTRRFRGSGSHCCCGDAGAFRSPSDSLNRDSAPPVFPVSRGFPVTTPGEGLLLSCPVLSGPFC